MSIPHIPLEPEGNMMPKFTNSARYKCLEYLKKHSVDLYLVIVSSSGVNFVEAN